MPGVSVAIGDRESDKAGTYPTTALETIIGDARARREDPMTTTVMTVEELAKRWEVSPKTIRGMIDRKELVALRVGRVIRISRSHVENLERGKDGGVAAR